MNTNLLTIVKQIISGHGEGILGKPQRRQTPFLQKKKKHLIAALIAVAAVHPLPANMVYIEGGTFTMGSPVNEPERGNTEVQHSVTVSSFYMSKYEVTQREWREVMGNNPSYFKGDDLPVEQVNWYDAIEYCNKRSEREGLTPAYTIDKSQWDNNNTSEFDDVHWRVTWNRNANGYRLPTEAEWEYACRAGTTTPFSTGNNITTNQANYDGRYPYNGNVKGTYRKETWEAGSSVTNSWGLYDMHGNVDEWCWDWYGDYPRGAQTDPAGADTGSIRVIRGGSWFIYAWYLRSAFRVRILPGVPVRQPWFPAGAFRFQRESSILPAARPCGGTPPACQHGPHRGRDVYDGKPRERAGKGR